MWIERLDVAGFGNLSGEKIEFKNNKLNLIIEPSQFGKSTIADALWAIIFDFPQGKTMERAASNLRDLRRPNKPQGPYFACVDLSIGSRDLKIIRDFNDGSVQVVDRLRGNADVTADYFTSEGFEEIGLRLTEVSRELFHSTFFVGQRTLQENPWQGNSELLSIFQSASESSSAASIALPVLNAALNEFSYAGSRGKLDAIIRNLEARQSELKALLLSFEGQRRDVLAQLILIGKIHEQLKESTSAQLVQEYFELCLMAAELDGQALQSQGAEGVNRELQLELVRLGHLQDFPIDISEQVESLWSRRLSRIEDYRSYESLMAPALKEFEEQKRKVGERLPGMERFSPEDVQNVTVLSNALQIIAKEVSELTQRRQIEASRVQSEKSVDLERVAAMRKALQPLDAHEVDTARTYEALINAARTQTADCERLIRESQALLEEIEEEKKGKKAAFFNAANKKREGELAEQQIQQQQELIDRLAKKVSSLEARLDVLAKKAGLINAAELLEHVNEYSTKSVAVRDIEALDQMLSTRLAIMIKNQLDIKPYFEKAGRIKEEITAESARTLVIDAARFVDEVRAMQANFLPAIQAKQELEQISTEICDIEGLLESIFMRANLTEPSNLLASYEEFRCNASLYDRLLEIQKVLASQHTASKSAEPDKQVEIAARRRQILNRMQELVKLHPEIADMSPPGSGQRSARKDDSELALELEQKCEFVRVAMNSSDAGYLETVQELDHVDYVLTHLRQARAAIELSRETLQRLSSENCVDVLAELNAVANRLLIQMGLEFAGVDFDADLRLTVRAKGQVHLVRTDQLSVSERAQAYLLARLSVCQILFGKTRLPIILDDVLSDFDDETFLRVMKYLLDLAKGNQVIMFSNQRLRFEWLMQNLTEEQKQIIAICRKTLLRSDSVAN